MENKRKPPRRERVYQKLAELTQQTTIKRINNADFPDHDAAGIGRSLDITMNNTCMELNALVKDGLAVKILGRPVYFFAKEELERIVGTKITQNFWENYSQFKEAMNQSRESSVQDTYPEVPTAETTESPVPFGSSFSSLVGAKQSLKKSIDQAKAAILYPPNGLHTLITGETGTGKSHFAEAMYDFAVETGQIDPHAKFAIYNCASYSENPQLLLSQLFGYKKGAFTGADRDSPGVIDQADGGVLFLDEVHRLSPEGQEKMFLLIDKGIFQRLGETREYRPAKIRIIVATTEDPQKALLSTFLRRIAVVIHIPPLEKRSFDERLRFIFRFLWDESINTRMPLYVDREVIRALTMYKCKGNIGQLRADIRCLCANAYLDCFIHPQHLQGRRCVPIELTHLPDSVESGLCETGFTGSTLFQRYAFYRAPYTTVDSTQGNYENLVRILSE